MSTAIIHPPDNRQLAAVKSSPLGTIRELLASQRDQIALALPRHLDADKVIRIAITAVQKQPKLLECSSLSVLGAVVEASQLGLYLDGILGEAYLVPFWNSKTSKLECQMQPGYRGLITLARRSGLVSTLYPELVYDCDFFKVKLGDDKRLEHEPNYDDPKRGTVMGPDNVPVGLRGAYAVIKYKDGESDFEYMPLYEILDIRARSKSKNKKGEVFGPWTTDFKEMAKKTPIRRLAKRCPLSPEFVKAAVMDEYIDAGVSPSGSTYDVEMEDQSEPMTEPEVKPIEAQATPVNMDAEPLTDEQMINSFADPVPPAQPRTSVINGQVGGITSATLQRLWVAAGDLKPKDRKESDHKADIGAEMKIRYQSMESREAGSPFSSKELTEAQAREFITILQERLEEQKKAAK